MNALAPRSSTAITKAEVEEFALAVADFGGSPADAAALARENDLSPEEIREVYAARELFRALEGDPKKVPALRILARVKAELMEEGEEQSVASVVASVSEALGVSSARACYLVLEGLRLAEEVGLALEGYLTEVRWQNSPAALKWDATWEEYWDLAWEAWDQYDDQEE